MTRTAEILMAQLINFSVAFVAWWLIHKLGFSDVTYYDFVGLYALATVSQLSVDLGRVRDGATR